MIAKRGNVLLAAFTFDREQVLLSRQIARQWRKTSGETAQDRDLREHLKPGMRPSGTSLAPPLSSPHK